MEDRQDIKRIDKHIKGEERERGDRVTEEERGGGKGGIN